MRKSTPLTFLVLAGFAAAALTGCSGNAATPAASTSAATAAPAETQPSAADQSVAEACKISADAMSSLSSEMSTSMQDAAKGDYAAVVEAMQKTSVALDGAIGQISNTEVKETLSDMSAQAKQFSDLFDGVKEGDLTALSGKADELQKLGNDMQATGNKISELCSGQ